MNQKSNTISISARVDERNRVVSCLSPGFRSQLEQACLGGEITQSETTLTGGLESTLNVVDHTVFTPSSNLTNCTGISTTITKSSLANQFSNLDISINTLDDKITKLQTTIQNFNNRYKYNGPTKNKTTQTNDCDLKLKDAESRLFDKTWTTKLNTRMTNELSTVSKDNTTKMLWESAPRKIVANIDHILHATDVEIATLKSQIVVGKVLAGGRNELDRMSQDTDEWKCKTEEQKQELLKLYGQFDDRISAIRVDKYSQKWDVPSDNVRMILVRKDLRKIIKTRTKENFAVTYENLTFHITWEHSRPGKNGCYKPLFDNNTWNLDKYEKISIARLFQWLNHETICDISGMDIGAELKSDFAKSGRRRKGIMTVPVRSCNVPTSSMSTEMRETASKRNKLSTEAYSNNIRKRERRRDVQRKLYLERKEKEKLEKENIILINEESDNDDSDSAVTNKILNKSKHIFRENEVKLLLAEIAELKNKSDEVKIIESNLLLERAVLKERIIELEHQTTLYSCIGESTENQLSYSQYGMLEELRHVIDYIMPFDIFQLSILNNFLHIEWTTRNPNPGECWYPILEQLDRLDNIVENMNANGNIWLDELYNRMGVDSDYNLFGMIIGAERYPLLASDNEEDEDVIEYIRTVVDCLPEKDLSSRTDKYGKHYELDSTKEEQDNVIMSNERADKWIDFFTKKGNENVKPFEMRQLLEVKMNRMQIIDDDDTVTLTSEKTDTTITSEHIRNLIMAERQHELLRAFDVIDFNSDNTMCFKVLKGGMCTRVFDYDFPEIRWFFDFEGDRFIGYKDRIGRSAHIFKDGEYIRPVEEILNTWLLEDLISFNAVHFKNDFKEHDSWSIPDNIRYMEEICSDSFFSDASLIWNSRIEYDRTINEEKEYTCTEIINSRNFPVNSLRRMRYDNYGGDEECKGNMVAEVQNLWYTNTTSRIFKRDGNEINHEPLFSLTVNCDVLYDQQHSVLEDIWDDGFIISCNGDITYTDVCIACETLDPESKQPFLNGLFLKKYGYLIGSTFTRRDILRIITDMCLIMEESVVITADNESIHIDWLTRKDVKTYKKDECWRPILEFAGVYIENQGLISITDFFWYFNIIIKCDWKIGASRIADKLSMTRDKRLKQCEYNLRPTSHIDTLEAAYYVNTQRRSKQMDEALLLFDNTIYYSLCRSGNVRDFFPIESYDRYNRERRAVVRRSDARMICLSQLKTADSNCQMIPSNTKTKSVNFLEDRHEEILFYLNVPKVEDAVHVRFKGTAKRKVDNCVYDILQKCTCNRTSQVLGVGACDYYTYMSMYNVKPNAIEIPKPGSQRMIKNISVAFLVSRKMKDVCVSTINDNAIPLRIHGVYTDGQAISDIFGMSVTDFQFVCYQQNKHYTRRDRVEKLIVLLHEFLSLNTIAFDITKEVEYRKGRINYFVLHDTYKSIFKDMIMWHISTMSAFVNTILFELMDNICYMIGMSWEFVTQEGYTHPSKYILKIDDYVGEFSMWKIVLCVMAMDAGFVEFLESDYLLQKQITWIEFWNLFFMLLYKNFDMFKLIRTVTPTIYHSFVIFK